MFKETGYEEMVLNRRAVQGRPYKSKPGPAHQPIGTRSESVGYFLDGERIAVCHQYVLPDGSLGASGKPDPKAITYDGVTLFCHSGPCECSVGSEDPEDWRKAVLEKSRGDAR